MFEMEELSIAVVNELRDAGWRSGGSVDLRDWVEALSLDGFPRPHAAARAFLARYGGLKLPCRGPGLSSVKEAFEIDPTLALGEADRFADWTSKLGSLLYPLGELDDGRYFLGIDERGEVYLVSDWLASFGRTDVAISHLVLGEMSRPV